jgi:acetylglutamate/LysW-gamma-L-alpha-aminoadipate kinase
MIILKIGGGAAINIKGIISDLADLQERSVIVHGANSLRDKLLQDLGIEKKVLTSLSGYSSVFTDQKALDILIMAYAGLRNKRIVELCQQNGLNAIGLAGIDGKVIQGKRNKGIKIEEHGKRKIVRDFSGKPHYINVELLTWLLENHYLPVLCVPILDENNVAINSENDDIVTILQHHLHAQKIVQFIEAPGFLKDQDDAYSLIKKMTKEDLEQFEDIATLRMKRKVLALRKLFLSGAASVIIADGRGEHPLADALKGKGTTIQ